jgi:hypothetical protein
MFAILSSFLIITCWFDFNVVLIGALVASHKSDQVKVPPNHAMEDADWVHEWSRWKCKINGCNDIYVAKWLFC